MCSHCLLSICNFYFPFWFLEEDSVFDCSSSCSQPTHSVAMECEPEWYMLSISVGQTSVLMVYFSVLI